MVPLIILARKDTSINLRLVTIDTKLRLAWMEVKAELGRLGSRPRRHL